MNARMLTSMVVVCAALTGMAGTAPTAGTPMAYNVKVASAGEYQLERGARRSEVLRMLGVPLPSSSGDVWLYSGYHVEEGSGPSNHDCTVLVVTLSQGRVTDMHLVNRSAAVVVAQAVRTGKQLVYVPNDVHTVVAQDR